MAFALRNVRFWHKADIVITRLATSAFGGIATQQLYGQTANTARQTATTLDSWLRNAIETQPYTTAAVAFGIGWLLGRTRRPL